MKFFRMDSDFARWPEWNKLAPGDGRKRQQYMAVYMVLYAEIAAHYKTADQKTFELSEHHLARSVGMLPNRWRGFVGDLSKAFQFSVKFPPGICQINYPNFLKKQKIPKRDGDGKFSDSVLRVESRELRVENIKESRTPNGLQEPTEPNRLDTGETLNTAADSVTFSQNKNILNTDPPKEPAPPVEVGGQTDFDNSLARGLYEFIHAMDGKFGHAPTIRTAQPETWGRHIKRLRIEDGHSEDEIRAVVSYAVSDRFWKNQIQSAHGFRRMYPQILKQLKENKQKNKFGG